MYHCMICRCMIQIHTYMYSILSPCVFRHSICTYIRYSEHNIAIDDKLHMYSIMHSLHSRLEWTGMVNGQFIHCKQVDILVSKNQALRI